MAQDTKVQERTTPDTTDIVGNPVVPESTGTITDAATVFNSAYDTKKTKIKNTRNWYPEIDGNDVTKSYTTGF